MKEKIKLFAKQAEQYALDKANEGNDEDYDYSFDDDFQKKFAELIVQECMSMSDELKAQYLSFRKNTMDFDEKHIYAEGEAACDTLKYKMKKHFGVE
jgi:hypothetical protein